MPYLVLTATGGVSDDVVNSAQSGLAASVVKRLGVNAVEIAFEGMFSGDIKGVDVNVITDEQRAAKLFLADMDSTMIGQECIDELAAYANVKPQIAEITERAMLGELDFEAALRARVSLLGGLDETALQSCFDDQIVVNAGAAELLAGLKAADIRCVLVSGGFNFFASRVAAKLGFDRYVANEFEVIDAKLTGGLLGDIVDRPTKARVLRDEANALGIDLSQTITIGDGANDLDMIEAAGVGVAYRAKPALEEAANITLRHSDLDALLNIIGLR